MNGVLLVNKPKGCTSRDVVNVISKKFNIKKVGHTGTLDPIATGVLVICLGSATKLVDMLTSTEKEYIATIQLGIETDTLDNTGNTISTKKSIISRDNIVEVLNSMIGKYDQEVPIYSAVKVNGKKLYEYARNNEKVCLPKREVEIKSIELISDIHYENETTIFKFKCLVSKGTYIRSLIRDIAYKLNTYGIMTDLIRTRQGNFKIGDCIDLDNIEIDNVKKIKDILNIKKVRVDKLLENKIRNGQILDNIYGENKVLFINENDEELSIYQVYEKDKSKIKPYIMLGGN